jgi:4-diphosphocytidyl-2-C-methyl-D-erythritol kinase
MIRLPAFAKINRDLRIVGRDAEGYHLISTVFETVALHDTISLDVVEGPLRVTCSDPSLPTDGRNLVTRMVHAWCGQHRDGVTDGFHVHVEKRIPMQAGLGGGSADAAATLIALTMQAKGFAHPGDARAALSDGDRRLAASLGADVAFFLVGGRALGTGRGEVLRPLDEVAAKPVVLAKPDFGVPTADAYRWFADSTGLLPGQTLRRCDGRGRPGAVECTNDLEAVVAARFPAIGQFVAALYRCGARQAAMTGSGSVVYGVFDGDQGAACGEDVLRALGARVWRTTTLPRADCWPAVWPVIRS